MTVLRNAFLSFAALAILAGTAGCSLLGNVAGNTAGSAANSAGSTVGSNAGNRIGNAILGPATPGPGPGLGGAYLAQYMTFYTQYMFSLAFGSGGYAVSTTEYKPGQFTRWTMPGEGKESTIERAYLFDDSEGNQWWKVKLVDGKSGDTTVLEALLSPKDQKMLRLRGKFPKEEAGKEMAVNENSYYAPPQKLSKKSIEGATVGTESITVPAGTFNARHVVFGEVGSTHEWWLDEKVPGGTVKQLLKAAEPRGSDSGHDTTHDSSNWIMMLAAFGNGAKTELGAK